jgi:hypothetical protein
MPEFLADPAASLPTCRATRRSVLSGMAGLSAAALTGLPALAKAGLDQPKSRVLLTVRGLIDVTNAGDTAEFDDDMLGALPQVEFTTSTIWTTGKQRFSGPSLRRVLDLVQARGSIVSAEAANAYSVNLPFDMIEDQAPILARRIDGKPFGLRDRGPLWLVYPYDSHERFRTEAAYAQSIWQLVALTVSRT